MTGLIAGTSQAAWVLWRNPALPSSTVSQCAPHWPRASKTPTESPALARYAAAVSPLMPPPMTTTS